jgi:hypothetical protein
VEPLGGVAPDQFFAPEDFINEMLKHPKMQKYSKYEKRSGYAEKKKIFRAKKSPQTLDVRGDPVKSIWKGRDIDKRHGRIHWRYSRVSRNPCFQSGQEIRKLSPL